MQGLADSLDEILLQGIGLLESLDQEAFTTANPLGGGASIGAHYRHCLDHFRQLFAGLENGTIDYDARTRESLLENDLEAAIAVTEALRNTARKLRQRGAEEPLEVRCGVNYENQKEGCASSTLGREMMFCISHSIHHYALIAIMLRSAQRNVPEGFGVAPSTMHHRQRLAGAR